MKLTKTLLLEQLALVFKENEIGPPMNAHEFNDYELEIHLNNPYIPIEEEIIDMLDERDDATNNEFIEEVTVCKLRCGGR